MRIRKLGSLVDALNDRGYLWFIPDKVWIKYSYKKKMGKKLNLKDPQTFNEKLQWMKLNYRDPICTRMVDKYEAKQYVAERIGTEYIIPTYGVWDRFEDIDFDSLPDQFVLKCTHDSGGLVICREKAKLNKEAAKRKIEKCFKRNYFWHGREWPYKNVKPRIIAEKYMEDVSSRELVDYKFYCFNGKPEFLYVSTGLENHATASISFFDFDFKKMPFYRADFKQFDEPPKKPEKFAQMIELAAELSQGFPFLRVDLYQINGQIYFSELTFIPSSGTMPLEPASADLEMGKLLNLGMIDKA